MSQNNLFIEPSDRYKRLARQMHEADNANFIDVFHRVFVQRSEPYTDSSGRFAPDWRQWTPALMERLPRAPMRAMFGMAYIDDYQNLNRILPDYYRTRGGLAAFERDIERIGVARGYHSDYELQREQLESRQRSEVPSNETTAVAAANPQDLLSQLGGLAKKGIALASTGEVEVPNLERALEAVKGATRAA